MDLSLFNRAVVWTLNRLIWIDFFILRIFEHLGVKSVLTPPPEKVEIEIDDGGRETNKQTNEQSNNAKHKRAKTPVLF